MEMKIKSLLADFKDGEMEMENEVWNKDGGKGARNGSRSEVNVYLHQSKREEGWEDPA